ncbi:MAG: endolytic transglycosylase MltG [Actinomycetota bacterium]|nr:endolytic transglycosylase MltG [Actinomycetota bacterium]
MGEPGPQVRRRAGGGVARSAALTGLLLGVGALAALSWGLTTLRDGSPPPPPTTTRAAAPRKPVLRIVFPEGFTRRQMAERIAAVNEIAKRKRKVTTKLSPKAYLRLTKRGKAPRGFGRRRVPRLEGFLFPATYEFTEDTTTRGLVHKQLQAFELAWSRLNLRYARSKNLDAYDVLIIASMVEKEVLVPRERALVAAVIYNRLRLDLPLGIDATIRYGLGVPPTESLHRSELDDPNAYNTRIHPGLPPTPISNPGLAAMEAAAHPARVDYLYFVRKADCKSHFFTASESEFYRRVAGRRC